MNSAERAERIALAILSGEIPAERMGQAWEELALANRETRAERHADAVRRFRAGEHMWAIPATVPWLGF